MRIHTVEYSGFHYTLSLCQSCNKLLNLSRMTDFDLLVFAGEDVGGDGGGGDGDGILGAGGEEERSQKG